MRLVDHFQRGDADGTPRSVHKFDFLWKEVVDSVLHDAVRLAAAEFHQYPWTGNGLANFISEFTSECLGPIFVDVFHVSSSINCPSSSSTLYVRCASSSSMRLRAKPTCTRT